MPSLLRKIRTFRWLTSEFSRKHKRILLLSALIGVGSFLFITKILPILPTPKPTQRIGLVGRYTWENLPGEVLNNASLGLTLILEDGSAAPSLAEDWQAAKDGKSYTFTLRDDLFWQDGTPLQASELDYNFTDVEVTVNDQKTVKFTLKEAFAPFPIVLSRPVFKNNYLGVGKYEIKKIKKKNDLIEQIYMIGKDKNLVYKAYPNSQTALEAFKLGEIDLLEGVFDINLGEEWQKKIKVDKKVKKNQYIGAFFNLNDPMLGDKSLRQALAYSLKKDYGLKRATGPISPLSWAYNQDVKTYDFDSVKAKELWEKILQESEEATESAEKAEGPLNFKISTTQTLLPIAEEIKTSWKEVLGVEVKIELVNYLPENFQILLIGQEIPADPDQYSLWHSTQEQNFTHYQNFKIDKLLEDARTTTEQEKRKELYFDFQRFLTEDAPVIFLYHPEAYSLSRH